MPRFNKERICARFVNAIIRSDRFGMLTETRVIFLQRERPPFSPRDSNILETIISQLLSAVHGRESNARNMATLIT